MMPAVAQGDPVPGTRGVYRLGSELVNWYLVVADDGATVVDAGLPRWRGQLDDGLGLAERPLSDVRAVVLTHADGDHVGVAEKLRSELGVPVLVHEDAAEQARTAKLKPRESPSMRPYLRHRAAWRLFAVFALNGARQPKIAEVTTYADDDILDVPGRPRVVAMPGHSPGHCALWFQDAGALFVGDALCNLNPLTGRTGVQLMPRPFTTSVDEALASLDRLGDLPESVLCFGHGEPWPGVPAEAADQARRRGPT
jgi:glyoxylase-like metal-dependent hydrolase (beta-lactamase superfamily II)